MPTDRGHRPKLRRKIVEGRLGFIGENLPKYFSMFGLGGTPMTQRAALQPNDQIVVDIAHMKIAGHLRLDCSHWEQ